MVSLKLFNLWEMKCPCLLNDDSNDNHLCFHKDNTPTWDQVDAQ